jgi:hypothetical protein
MLRVALTLYMVVVLAAGPGLCCCTTLPRRAGEDEPPPCACCPCQQPSADPSEPLLPGPDDHRCPCRAARLQVVPVPSSDTQSHGPPPLSLDRPPAIAPPGRPAAFEAPHLTPFGERPAVCRSLPLRC